MRGRFFEFFSMSDEEMDNLWSKGTVAFDANVLLNLYRYSPKTCEVLLNLIQTLRDRTWIPHQVGVEFFRRRHDVIAAELKNCQNLNQSISDFVKAIDSDRSHPFISDSLKSDASDLFTKLQAEIETSISNLNPASRTDPILEQLARFLPDESVGHPFQDADLDEELKNGKDRYENNIPPGFKDKKKETYGDYLIWKQLLNHSKHLKPNTGMIFVTDDAKEDWWMVKQGKTISPLPELLREFSREVPNQHYYQYTMGHFLELAREKLQTDISLNVVKEVEEKQKSLKRKTLKQKRQVVVTPISPESGDTAKRRYLSKFVVQTYDAPEEVVGAIVQQIRRITHHVESGAIHLRIQKVIRDGNALEIKVSHITQRELDWFESKLQRVVDDFGVEVEATELFKVMPNRLF